MNKVETSTRILNAAGPIFATKGFEAATVREICKAADVNLASINYHFGDKESLYLETVRHAHRLRAQQVPHADYDPKAKPEENLRLFLRTLLSRVLGVNAQAWQSQLMMREVLDPTEACRDMVESFIRPQLNQLQEILRPLLPSGLSRAERTQIAFSIIGQVLFYRFAGKVAELLTANQSRTHYDIAHLEEHILRFSLAALQGYHDPDSTSDTSSAGQRRQPKRNQSAAGASR